jgi:RNA polymerase sigma factor (sigma-70 family)
MTTHSNQSDEPPAPTDAQLLEQFVASRDELAFAMLVSRHAAMVWRVCCRILRDYHDAEDAFQATFVVLSRKAAVVVPREMLANWLFGVARVTALKLRSSRDRTRQRQAVVGDLSQHPAPDSSPWDEFYSCLYEELAHLPARYRTIVIQCDLEGKTRKEVARELNVPEGSVAGWLNRARKLLARRLARHGGLPLGIAIGTLLSREVLASCEPQVPPAILASTDSPLATGAGIPSHVTHLAERVITMMFLGRLQTAVITCGLAPVVLLCGFAVIQSCQAQTTTANAADQETATERAAPAKQATEAAPPATVKTVLASVVRVHTKKLARGREIDGLGMATAIDERGILLTPHHIVAGVRSITVEFPDRKQFEARLLASDEKHDLALLQITERLPVVKLGDSSTLDVGDSVRAAHRAGPPTLGRVTALGRKVELTEQTYENLIQHDAALSPGDSGGPLIDAQGRVIGINVALRAGRERIGFALPINAVRPVIDKLLKSADMERKAGHSGSE